MDAGSSGSGSAGSPAAMVPRSPAHGSPALGVLGSAASRSPASGRRPRHRCAAALACLGLLGACSAPGFPTLVHTQQDDPEPWYAPVTVDEIHEMAWHATSIPTPVALRSVGTVVLHDRLVLRAGALVGPVGLVAWARGRFSAAGLDPPVVTTVTFLGPTSDQCHGITGFASVAEVTVCFLPGHLCADPECTAWHPRPRWTTLHELGHVWLGREVDATIVRAFVARAGLPTWADTRHPWERRGVELAASVLAWGLMEEPAAMHRSFRARSCRELTALYRTLTGRAPVGRACRADAGGHVTAAGPAPVAGSTVRRAGVTVRRT